MLYCFNFNPTKHRCLQLVLYKNIDQTLRNKSHGPMHFKIGVYTEHEF